MSTEHGSGDNAPPGHQANPPQPTQQPPRPAPRRINAVRELAELLANAQRNHHWAIKYLERIAAEVILHEFTPSEHLHGQTSMLVDLVAKLEHQAVGRLTSAYGGGQQSQRSGRVDSKTFAIAKRADIDDRICQMLQRNHLRRFIILAGKSALLEALRVGCKACRHSRVVEIDAMLRDGHTVRDVAYWTARQNEPVSKSTLHTHRHHITLPGTFQLVQAHQPRDGR